MAAHESGVYVGGYTQGTFPGQTNAGSIDAFLRKYDSNGNLLWTRQFGSAIGDRALSISVNATGIFVVGYSAYFRPTDQYTFLENFVRKYDFQGNLLWAQQMDTFGKDGARGVFADETGAYVAGFFEADVFPEQTNAGGTDAYIRKYDNAGNVLWTLEIGSSGSDEAAGVAVAPDGVYLAGGTTGKLPLQTAREASSPKTGRPALSPDTRSFVAKVTPPPPAMPVVYNGGVVNNASYAPSSSGVAPGSIAAVFGTSLNDGASVLSSALGADGNLVTSLGDAMVTIDGIVAPMFYSTPGQLGIQIPFELAGQSTAALRVTVGDQTSAPETIFLGSVAAGIFTANQQGTGLAVALHQDGATVITPQNPAHPGEVIALFATGLGPFAPPLETGTPATGNQTVMQPTASIDGLPATVEFSGAAPGYVGLYQINIRIPEGARIPTDIPVVLTIDGNRSNTVTTPVVP